MLNGMQKIDKLVLPLTIPALILCNSFLTLSEHETQYLPAQLQKFQKKQQVQFTCKLLTLHIEVVYRCAWYQVLPQLVGCQFAQNKV